MEITKLSRSERDLMIAIARAYYQDNQTQAEIAQRYGKRQTEVSRYLQRAKALGIVQIVINPFLWSPEELQDRLRAHFPYLQDAIIVPTLNPLPVDGDTALVEDLGTACAQYFLETVPDKATIGVSCGVGVAEVVKALGQLSAQRVSFPRDCRVYSLITLMVSVMEGLTPASLVADWTRWLPDSEGTAFHLPLDEKGIQVYKRNPIIKQLESDIQTLDYYIVGIGYIQDIKNIQRKIKTMKNRASYEFNSLVLRLEIMDELIKQGAVGESIFQPFDAKGNFLLDKKDEELKDLIKMKQNMIYLNLRALQEHVRKKTATVIAVAGGVVKQRAIYAALRAEICNVLVTDTTTAEYLLAAQEQPAEGLP